MSPVPGIAVLWSAFDDGHVAFVVPLAHGRREVVQPFDLLLCHVSHRASLSSPA
jgi:hypothetical protein